MRARADDHVCLSLPYVSFCSHPRPHPPLHTDRSVMDDPRCSIFTPRPLLVCPLPPLMGLMHDMSSPSPPRSAFSPPSTSPLSSCPARVDAVMMFSATLPSPRHTEVLLRVDRRIPFCAASPVRCITSLASVLHRHQPASSPLLPRFFLLNARLHCLSLVVDSLSHAVHFRLASLSHTSESSSSLAPLSHYIHNRPAAGLPSSPRLLFPASAISSSPLPSLSLS